MLRFRIVLTSKVNGLVRLREDASFPVDYSRTLVLRESRGEILVPRGFLTKDPPVFYRVERIEDASGAVLAVGDDPIPGEWGLLGLPNFGGPGAGYDPKRPREVRQYFKFGTKAGK